MSTPQALVVEVQLHDDRYHGEPEWPPAPARLFQALLAGCAQTTTISAEAKSALSWLETLSPPVIGTPRTTRGKRVKLWVPNNDLDAKRGDPAQIANIRTAKWFHPWLFNKDIPFLYAWPFAAELNNQAEAVCALAGQLYQFGRGIDMAWARAAILPRVELEEHLESYRGRLFEPCPGARSVRGALACPQPGSLVSLVARHEAMLGRLQTEGTGRKSTQVFQQPPKPRFAQVPYNNPPSRTLFELQPLATLRAFASQPLTTICTLTEALRDAAATRLAKALPEQAEEIERALVGRTPMGWSSLSPRRRVRLIALPSIGHRHTERSVRRLLVEVPSDCPLRPDDVAWAFSGLVLPNKSLVLARTNDQSMLGHYAIAAVGSKGNVSSAVWRTVTPIVVPERAARRRIDPARQSEQAKPAAERVAEETQAVAAVRQALRHVGLACRAQQIHVQREPFEARGTRAEEFASETRFSHHRMWHVELHLEHAVDGPLLLGDGRFLGLGLCAPMQTTRSSREGRGIFAFEVRAGWTPETTAQGIARALRRAVMARFQAQNPAKALPSFVSGHARDGTPAKDKPHLHFVCDPETHRLFVIAPHLCRRDKVERWQLRHLTTLAQAMDGFDELRAGKGGRLLLQPVVDPSFPSGRHWVSRTPYVVCRHRKGLSAAVVLADDLRASCRAAQLAEPEVNVLTSRGVPGQGLTGKVELCFPTAIQGPLLLGRTRHLGGGWFALQ